VRVGDRIIASPSGRTARVSRIVTFDGDLDYAYAPMSVTLTLDDEIDISRGDTLSLEPPTVGTEFEADVVWMDERHAGPGPRVRDQAVDQNRQPRASTTGSC